MRYNVGFVNQVIEKITEYDNKGGFIYLITLTVRDEDTEKNIRCYTISNFFGKMEYRGFRFDGYLWTKELQRRGVIHYHVLVLSPVKLSGMHSHIEAAWGLGFVFLQRVLPSQKKFRSVMNYVFKYIFKGSEINDKVKRRMGRGGILRFRVVPFLQRVALNSDFDYVGSMSSKGMRVKIYRFMNLVMFVSSGVYGVSIDIVDWDIEIGKIKEKIKYGMKNSNKIGSLLKDPGYLALDKVEREDVLGYHRFDRAVNRLLWELKV